MSRKLLLILSVIFLRWNRCIQHCVWLQKRSVIASPGKDHSQIWIVLALCFISWFSVSVNSSMFPHSSWIQETNNCHIARVMSLEMSSLPLGIQRLRFVSVFEDVSVGLSIAVWENLWQEGEMLVYSTLILSDLSLSFQWAIFTLENRKRTTSLTWDLKIRLEFQLLHKKCMACAVSWLFWALVSLAVRLMP